MDIPWESAAKSAVGAGIGLGNEGAGAVAKVLIAVFWTDKKDVWADIRDKVAAMIDEKIADLVHAQAVGHLTGWRDLLDTHGLLIKNRAGPSAMLDSVRGLDREFTVNINEFQTKEHEVALLPFFAQAATMHLSVLRDAVMQGAAWGADEGERQTKLEELQACIAKYQAHVADVMKLAEADKRAQVARTGHLDGKGLDPFKQVNRHMRWLVLSVQDFADLWPRFDPTVYPPSGPPMTWPTREIYSDPLGSTDNSGDIYARLKTAPTQPIRGVVVCADRDWITNVRVLYPDGGGPNGQKDSGVMGQPGRGSELPPFGGKVAVGGDTTITAVDVRSGDVIEGLRFIYRNGASSRSFGYSAPDRPRTLLSQHGHMVSSIHLNGASNFYHCADSIVVGFKYDPAAMTSMDLLERMYTASPLPLTLERILALTPSNITLDSLAAAARDQDWEGKRKALWKNVAKKVATLA